MESFLPDNIFDAIEQLRGSLKYEFFYKPILTYSTSPINGEDVLYLCGKSYTVDDPDRLMEVLKNEFYYCQSKGFYYIVLREEQTEYHYPSKRAYYYLVLVVKPISENEAELKLYLIVRAPGTILPEGVRAYES